MGKINYKKYLILYIFPLLLLLVLFFAYSCSQQDYTEGRIPTKNAGKYFIDVKVAVFRNCISSDTTSWLRIEGKYRNSFVVYATDSAKFNNLFFGKDSLAMKTSVLKPEFKCGSNEDLGRYLTLPIEKQNDENDYVMVPTWLMSVLIDEKVLDMNKKNL